MALCYLILKQSPGLVLGYLIAHPTLDARGTVARYYITEKEVICSNRFLNGWINCINQSRFNYS